LSILMSHVFGQASSEHDWISPVPDTVAVNVTPLIAA